jgi:hypothetical protein
LCFFFMYCSGGDVAGGRMPAYHIRTTER